MLPLNEGFKEDETPLNKQRIKRRMGIPHKRPTKKDEKHIVKVHLKCIRTPQTRSSSLFNGFFRRESYVFSKIFYGNFESFEARVDRAMAGPNFVTRRAAAL